MRRWAVAAALALAAAAAPPACAATTATTSQVSSPAPTAGQLIAPTDVTKPPAGYELSATQALQIAQRVPKVRRERAKHPGSYGTAYEKGFGLWQVSFFAPGPKRKEIAQVLLSDATGHVLEAWTGFQVAWTMARGYPGAFGRKVNLPWIWVPLSVLFVVPFVNPRRPFRWLHLDLLVLSAFSISLAFFNHADIGISVPIVYPLLAYLLVRMTVLAVRRRPVEPVRLLVPASWLAVAAVFLVGFRIGLNVASSNVIDVGYSGVIGADRLSHGQPLYGNFPADDQHGDTYGPVAYEAYVPFERILPWSGTWDDLPAAHVAAVFFDLLCAGLLWLLGRRVRGPTLGIALAYAWLTYPFTIYVSNSNTNDALVALLVVLTLLVAARPAARGAGTALATLTKFAPLALAPVLATHDWQVTGRRRLTPLVLFAVGFAVAAAIAMVPVFLHDSLSAFYHRSVGFQAGRGSPFSIWGLYGWVGAQHVVQALGVVFAVALALVPRRRDIAGLAAACAAVLIGLQLGVTHWFYLYLPWFFGLLMLALLGRAPVLDARAARPVSAPAPGAARPRQPAVPVTSSARARP